jgi:hypothetical protein
LIVRETVAVETLASRATSLMFISECVGQVQRYTEFLIQFGTGFIDRAVISRPS